MGKYKRVMPANLFERNGAFYYRRGRKEFFVGNDRKQAFAEAAETNLALGLCRGRESHSLIYNPDLLSENAIVERAMPVSDICGVYFLLHESKIVYVGQSRNCHKRIAEHITPRK